MLENNNTLNDVSKIIQRSSITKLYIYYVRQILYGDLRLMPIKIWL